MFRRIWAVTQKEFIQTLRDRRTLAITLSIPMIQLLLFGFALRMNVKDIPMTVADQSLDGASRAYIHALAASGYFRVVAYVPDQAEVVRAIDEGRAQAGVVIPPRFAAHVERGDAQALLLVDGSDVFTSQSALNAATAVAQAHALEVLLRRVERAGTARITGGLLPLEARIHIRHNPDLNDLWFLIPSVLAMLLQTQSIALTAAAVVREREGGTIEQILVTPIRPGELMLGKIAPNMVITMLNMLTIVGLGVYLFRVPFQGDFWLFFGLSFMYVFSGLGLGILLSTIAHSHREVVQLVMAIALLGVILGGFIFPRYAMPPLLRIAGNLFPLTYFIPIARGIISKGVGLAFIWQQVVALFIYIVVVLVAAARAFRRGLD